MSTKTAKTENNKVGGTWGMRVKVNLTYLLTHTYEQRETETCAHTHMYKLMP